MSRAAHVSLLAGALLSVATACAQQHEMKQHWGVAPNAITALTGTVEQVSAFQSEYEGGSQIGENQKIVFVDRRHLSSGQERLRFRMPADLPYREIGGFIFLAQRHGLTIEVEGLSD